jgi:beta-galactosidase
MFKSIFLASLCLVGVAASAMDFKAVASFTSTNQIRIQGQLESLSNGAPLNLSCSIISARSGRSLWQGPVGEAVSTHNPRAQFQFTVSDLKPEIWEPSRPNLYLVLVTATQDGKPAGQFSFRTGFRSFETRNGQLILNGRPIFLRGLAINPPGRTVPPEIGESPVFAHDYVSFLKSQNVNIIRMTHDSQAWFDVCDELGMLVYQGQYGSPLRAGPNKQRPPENLSASVEAYEALFTTYSPHPSILIYILSNELPTSGARGKAFHDFLTAAHTQLHAWDPTRLIIGNAGYGEGREGDICDVHRYWGWYYNSFLTYYNLREPHLFGDPDKNQAITFTECVGNFTGPSGEYNLVVRKQLGAQLNWTGHSPNQRQDALTYQSFMVKQAAESFRRLRPLNPRLCGLMPFTILFDHWSGITSFSQMNPKPAMAAMATAYQPILLSLEFWTPNVFAGSRISGFAHIVNDSDQGLPLADAGLRFVLRDKNHEVLREIKQDAPTVPYYSTARIPVEITLPAGLKAGTYFLQGEIVQGGKVVSKNEQEFFVTPTNWPGTEARSQFLRSGKLGSLRLYDPTRRTFNVLKGLGVNIDTLSDLSKIPAHCKGLVLGESALGSLDSRVMANLKKFVLEGGRVLCLAQDPTHFSSGWLPEAVTFFTSSPNDPAYPPRTRPFKEDMNVNLERPAHPVFAGLDRSNFRLWSDYTGWDQSKPGFPRLYPVSSGFKLARADSVARTAILADYDRGLEGVSLCEMFSGKGSVLLSGFDLIPRAGSDPIAQRLLLNLINFTLSPGGHEVYPRITEPIQWGDYASERGLICGPQNGLVVDAAWVRPPTNPNALPLTQSEGAWNTRPGDEFRPHGRTPFGPYGYSTGSSLKELGSDPLRGTGFFCATLPKGKTNMLTMVESSFKGEQELKIRVNGQAQAYKLKLEAGQPRVVATPILPGTTNVLVQFEGQKTLVLRRTVFE